MRSSNSSQSITNREALAEYSDAALAHLLLETQDSLLKEMIRDEFFSRYYYDVDSQIARIFKQHELEYSDANPYYNLVFNAVYERIFSMDRFEAILLQFDPDRGEFKKWFLKWVVANKVRDWLRVRGENSTMRNVDAIRSLETNTLRLDDEESAINKNRVVEYQKPAEAEDERSCDNMELLIAHALERMEPENSVIIKLLYLHDRSLTEPEDQFLVSATDRDGETLKRDLFDLRELLSRQHQARMSRKDALEQSLMKLAHTLSHINMQIYRLVAHMMHMGFTEDHIEDLARQAQKYRLGDIKLLQKNCKKERYACIQQASKALRKDVAFEYMYLMLRYRKKEQRKTAILSKINRLHRLPYREVAQLLDLSASSVYTREKNAIEELRISIQAVEETIGHKALRWGSQSQNVMDWRPCA